MKALRILVPLVLAGVIVLVVTSRLGESSRAEGYRFQREALRREAVERATVARGVAGPAGIEEARAMLRWWFESAGALRERFPAAAKEEQSRLRGKDVNKEEAWFRYADERLQHLERGYSPVASAAERGMRLDVLAVSAGEHPDSHERGVRIDFALWGAPRRLERESASVGESGRGTPARPAATAVQRVVVPLSFPKLGLRFLDGAGKAYGEMIGSGEPYLLLKPPERFSDALPPGVTLGTWWVEPFPREAARVELTVGVQVAGMTSGALLAPEFRAELAVLDEWKLRPGETFRAETRVEAPAEPAGK
jgi:hypothetical protein